MMGLSLTDPLILGAIGIAAGLLLLLLVYFAWRGRRARDAQVRLDARLDDLGVRVEQVSERLAELRVAAATEAGRQREDAARHLDALEKGVTGALAESRVVLVQGVGELSTRLAEHRAMLEQRQSEALKQVMQSVQAGLFAVQREVSGALGRTAEELGRRVEALTASTDQRLQDISGRVEQRLADGFEKTTATFTDVVQRLALIDEAQRKIAELAGSVVSLQQILADKRSRGAFGEVQLAALVRNVVPEGSFALQYTLPNGCIADCVLFLPPPTGTIALDAKFPLEAYRRATDTDISELERRAAERQFKIDVRKHVRDIASRYIIPGTTSDGAVMFIPAEAVFAEIQARHPDLVEEAHGLRVWMVSPTTLWAILNTARAVLKDAATREQVHLIQEHLAHLAKDFERFRERMDALARHIKQAHDDVQDVSTSARKITARFERIERVELDNVNTSTMSLKKSE